MKVIKFGGTSLADAAQIKKVCEIILEDPARRLVVVSAPGKRFSGDAKVTDMLIDLAYKCIEGKNYDTEYCAVTSRYESICKGLGLESSTESIIRDDILGRISKKDNMDDSRFLDLMKAAGEDNSAKVVAAYFVSIGVDAVYMDPRSSGMILSDEFGNARVIPSSYEKLACLAQNKSIMIFPGFFGYSEKGDVVTFSRGGSDVTGAVLAAAVDADVYENFTDVDSVYAANPNIVKNPCPIPLFTYEEMRELSYAGFTVLHEEALEPVYRKGIKVNIKNTNNPLAPGTFIVPDGSGDLQHNTVVGIAADKGFLTIHVQKYMMNREIGFGRKLLQILENERVSYEHTPSGIDSISIIIKEKNCNNEILETIVQRIYEDLKADKVLVEKDQAIVMIVGQGMSQKVGVSGRALMALAKNNINIKMINQGSSEVSIMVGVAANDAVASVKALYNEFFNN